MKKKLALVHTVNWYSKVINKPFAIPWAADHPEVEIINIMDDSLLKESTDNGEPTPEVIRRMLHYFMAAEATGADVIMSTCTTMGRATQIARDFVNVPLFNIDEPMAREAVLLGTKMGILATVPTSAPATRRLLEMEAKKINKEINVEIVINEEAFKNLLEGNIEKHNEIVYEELEQLQNKVDVLVLGQISLSQIKYDTRVPMLQVGPTGFAEASRLLGLERILETNS